MIYTYKTDWPNYSISWSSRNDKRFRLAVGSFLEEYSNKVQIIQLSEEKNELCKIGEFDHPYPPTKIMWIPDKVGKHPDIMATACDYLRIWDVSHPDFIQSKSVLSNTKNSDFCAPLTSFDWNEQDPSIIGTASIDTTCTIWNIETGQPKTQLIAHDKEVFDIAFARGTDIFASVGADSSIRMFDLRSLDHSTIIYESPDGKPLVRLAWNKQETNYIATFVMDGTKLIILDIRMPSAPVAELASHTSPINSFAWAPHSNCHICTVADDKQALVWDITTMKKAIDAPILAYKADGEINQVIWSTLQYDWVAKSTSTENYAS